MTPEELRADIPALEETTYMNTGASGPSPERVVEATERALEDHEYRSPADEGMYTAAFAGFDETRETVAAHLGADPSEIALTQSTTDGINRVACALEWEAGDVVVRTDLEHSAGILPWQRQRRRHGIDVRVVETDRGRIDLDEVKAAVDGAKLVVFSSLSWNYGTRLPVSDIVELAHDAGALVLVDAVQSPGQTPVDVEEWGADFVAAAGHKWLLGPWGTGFLYVSDEIAEGVHPGQVGYRSVEDSNASEFHFKSGARRFEIGTTSPAPYAGLRAGIELIEDLGYDAITAHVRELTDYLKAELGEERVLSPVEYESGLVTFAADDPEELVERLAEANVQIRSIPYPEAVRASIHVFNTREDVDRLLDVV
ncbi:MAG: aminotransferase class V-fold PLP-dependent enzyme [Salinigranum sp.]